MELLLVRHGETIENIQSVCQGHSHGTLSATGVEQAHALANVLAKEALDLCYCSDLQRAVDTCKIIALKHPNLILQHDTRLRERFFGDLQGKLMAKGWDGLADLSGAEAIGSMQQRVMGFFMNVKEQLLQQRKKVLVVSHGVTLRMLVAMCLGHGKAETLELPQNCSLTRLQVQNSGEFCVTCYNNTTHLQCLQEH